MSDINEVRGRLYTEANAYTGGQVFARCCADDVNALLADHARLLAMAEELERFRSMARWVSNCAGHGVNANQRRLGEELLVLIDAANAVQK